MRYSRSIRSWVVSSAVLATVLASSASLRPAFAQGEAADSSVPADAEKIQFYETQVRPLLEKNCYSCHGTGKIKGGLRLTSRDSVLTGGDTGPAVALDDPAVSVLLEAIRYESYEMPPKGKMAQEDIDTLTRWVEMGLPWTPGEAPHEPAEAEEDHSVITEEERSFWSFQPVRRPDVPSVRDSRWVTTAIDAFILARLEENDLAPAPPAEKAALLRRATYDLIGLPPTPEEVDAFLADDSPDAFEKVVDRLLASPHYGERWGRHWLDLVRFAETNSFERDAVKPNAWRYRDYVIGAFNADKPYDQFVREQLAGDELEQVNSESITATGFYRLGIWDDEPTDSLQARYDELDDIMATTSQVFLGITINCARCHDHKLDPIPQEDYYRFQAFFHGIKGYKEVDQRKGIETANILADIGSQADQETYLAEVAAYEQRREQVERRLAEFEEEALARIVLDAAGQNLDELSTGDAAGAGEKRPRPAALLAALSDLEREEYKQAKTELIQLDRAKPSPIAQALSVKGTRVVPATYVLIRGNASSPGKEVEPGYPQVFGFSDPVIPEPAEDAASSGRRRVLADWIASRENPLSARVMVNRLWQHHFGRGIVRSSNDFGSIGDRPTHPELLDWLAAEFVDGGWRVKRLHKMIMLSSAYRMSSRATAAGLAADPENNLLWRMDMRRLGAEEIRDSILAVNGKLNLKMGGPGVYPIISEEVMAGQSRPGDGWGNSSPEDQCRRSVYIHVKRSLVLPILASFDMADTDSSCPVRFATTQPTQALSMLNGEFLNEEAAAFAERLRREAGDARGNQVALALRLALQRRGTPAEIERGTTLIEQLEKEDGLDGEDALAMFCLTVLNLNEFAYLD